VATSTLRTAVIVALLVGGVLVLTQVFPEAERSGFAARSPSPSPSPTATGSPSPDQTEPPEEVDCSQISGVSVAVYNGTSVAELAKDWQERLQDEGPWVFPHEADNAPATVNATTVYFRNAEKDRAAAVCLQEEHFPDGRVRKLPAAATNVPGNVRIAIYLGPDATS
jgi:hypothetical protein